MLLKHAIKFANKFLVEGVAATPRKNMRKIHQMNKTEFVAFLKALKSKLHGSSLDLSDLKASEKVDGQAFRLGVIDGNIGAETSSSGMVFVPSHLSQRGHAAMLKHFKVAHEHDMLAIAHEFGDFKVIGELFYISKPELIDDDGSITFVSTKYSAKKFGKLGGLVLFDAKKIENGEVVDIGKRESNAIIDAVKSLSDDQFTIYNSKDISWKNKINIEFGLDSDILDNPDILLEPENKFMFEKFRDTVAKAFSDQISQTGSVLGMPGSMVEGIVFEINGNKYGATNFNWKENSLKMYKSQHDMQDAIDNFYKSIFGTIYTKKVAEAIAADPEKYQNEYQMKLPGLLERLNTIMDDFIKNDDIPKNIKLKLQILLGNTLKKFNALTDDIGSLYTMITRKPLK